MIFKRKIIKIKDSYYVGIDYPMIKYYDLKEKDIVDIQADEDKIIIRKSKDDK